ncbi:MAG: acylphosphatase [Chloroflexota bacterium]|nr:acylphosphatase [Chloroflexota bacterium]
MTKGHVLIRVYGRVQGVCFRYFTQDTAQMLKLKGYVRNLPSGDAVEVEAEGDKQQLDKLLEQLKIGPPAAWVKKVEVKWTPYSGRFTNFSIEY